LSVFRILAEADQGRRDRPHLSAALVRTDDGVAVELIVDVTTDGDVLPHAGE